MTLPTAPIWLVVDDTPASLGVVCDTFRAEGVRVLLAESGRAAREVLARTLPDLVLLDVVMPGEDGFAVCASLRADERWRDLPVIFLTAIDDPAQRVRAFAEGAVDYVTKPVHVPELLARVRVQLDVRTARRAIETKNLELESEIALRLDAEAQLATSLDRAVVVVGRRGEVLFATRLAHDLAAKYRPGAPLADFAHVKQLDLDGSELTVRRFTETGRDDLVMLAFEERNAPPGPSALLALGLTARQAEVAYWVAQGKSNPEIAIILGTSSRTIDKHMEHIFERLGVSNRSSLMVTVGESLR
jgi:DNA-binding response OmpR family regulator/DNA-binding CsgD family transcriptional regulator